VRLLPAVAAFALAFIAQRAIAGCAPGETPTYDDIRSIYVDRHALVPASHPQFTAHFVMSVSRNRETGVVTDDAFTGRLDSRNVPLKGSFIESDPHTFSILRATLKKHDFYALRLTPATKVILLDGPEDTITVIRCGVATSIGYFSAGEFVDPQNGQLEALRALLDDLQNAIVTFPWTPVPPSPTPMPTVR
jgi:hypothetical protein